MRIPLIQLFSKSALFLALCGLVCGESKAKIFAYVDSDGKLIISDRQEDSRFKSFDPANLKALHQSWSTRGSADGARHDERARRYNSIINDIAHEVGVNAHLLHAVIQVESAYNPQALSNKGAQGLMQLIPATAARFGVDEVYDPESNIRGGARYLKILLDRFDDDLQLTLAAYNAGEGAVQKYKNTIPPYPDTQAYVVRVLEIFQKRIHRERNSS